MKLFRNQVKCNLQNYVRDKIELDDKEWHENAYENSWLAQTSGQTIKSMIAQSTLN